MTENPKYKPLMQMLDHKIKQGAGIIFLWDCDHGNPAPRAIMADDAMLKVTSQHGDPLYVLELVGSESIIREYMQGSDEQVKTLEKSMLGQKSLESEYIPIFENLRAQKLLLQSPDPRAEVLQHFMDGLSTPDKNLITGYFNAVQSVHPEKTSIQALTQYMTGLSPAERDGFYALMPEFARAVGFNANSSSQFDTTVTDQIIAARVQHGRSAPDLKDHTTVMIYGAGHFTKSTPDLDELSLLKGEKSVSVAVAGSPASEILQTIYSSGKHNDMPDYVWYSDEDRLVKLDNNKAKAEFLGIKPSQVAMFEKTGVWPQSGLHNPFERLSTLPPPASDPVSHAMITGSPTVMWPQSGQQFNTDTQVTPGLDMPVPSKDFQPAPVSGPTKKGVTRG